jgi:glutathione S-transferase
MATYRYQRVLTPSPNPDVLEFLKGRLDDFLGILERHLSDQTFVIGERPTVADLSILGYLQFPKEETGYDIAASHPSINQWLQRVRALPSWQGAYELLPGKHMPRYA